MAVWAIISGLTGLVKNYHGMLILRFFLGVAEAPVSLRIRSVSHSN